MGPGNYNRRSTLLDDEALRHVLDFLIDLRVKSDPVGAESTEPGKHVGSLEAIFYTGLVAETLCAWAFDHIIGTVKEGFAKVPSSGEADDHRFELSGRSYEPGDPSADREILARLISMGGVVPLALRQPLVRALHALGAGETVDLVRPAPTGMWRSPYSLSELRLLAVCHVFLRWGCGTTKKQASEDIADCLGASPGTLRTWETTWLPRIHKPTVKAIYNVAKRAGAVSRWIEDNPGQSHEDRVAFAFLMQLQANPIEKIADAHRRLQKRGTSKR